MIFEFINPSDPYHFEAPDLEIAAFVTLLLGNGKGAAHEVDEEKEREEKLEVPMFMFGGLDEWIHEKFGITVADFITHIKKDRKDDLIKSLESVTIGSFRDFELFQETLKLIDDPEKRKVYRNKYHDLKRSSINDFGSFAWEEAKSLKEESE